jgi:predicted heme/steroid binding protein
MSLLLQSDIKATVLCHFYLKMMSEIAEIACSWVWQNGATVTIYANGNNLTDETDVRYAGNRTINQSESYGEHYTLGFRVNY